jgi:hypothetical protein
MATHPVGEEPSPFRDEVLVLVVFADVANMS